MSREFLTLTEICQKYPKILIEGSMLVGDIDRLFLFNKSYSEATKNEIDYFDFFEAQALELMGLLNSGAEIFTNTHSMGIYNKAIEKLYSKLHKDVKCETYKRRLDKILKYHKIAYRNLDARVVRLDFKSYHLVLDISEKSNQYLTPNVLSIFKLGLEKTDKGFSVAIVTNNNKFKDCVRNTNNPPPVYIGDSKSIDPFYYIF